MSLFRFDLYGGLRAHAPQLLDDAEAFGKSLGIAPELKGRIGISGSNSSAPGVLRAKVRDGDRRRIVRILAADSCGRRNSPGRQIGLWR